MRMNARLIKGLDKEDIDKFEKSYNVSKKILLKIRAEIVKQIEASYIEEEHLEEVSATTLARTLGYRRGLREVLTYLPEE